MEQVYRATVFVGKFLYLIFDIFHLLVLGAITPLAPSNTLKSFGGLKEVKPIIAISLAYTYYLVRFVL